MSMRIAFSVLMALGAVVTLSAQNWPAWRGPQANGISTEKSVPLKWSTTENVAWKLPLPAYSG